MQLVNQVTLQLTVEGKEKLKKTENGQNEPRNINPAVLKIDPIISFFS